MACKRSAVRSRYPPLEKPCPQTLRTRLFSLSFQEAIRKEKSCFQGATVTALRGRALAVETTRPRKAVTVAPKISISGKLHQIDFSDSL